MRANEESLFDILGTKCSWFRMSNISYPEISDSQKAVEELRMAEYFRSLEFTKEPSKTDIREVLDLLTVSELREISTLVLSKVDIPIQQSYLWYGSSIGDKDPQFQGLWHIHISTGWRSSNSCFKIGTLEDCARTSS
ncbi:uncharacterized protein LOC131246332 isoform X8 [Magnolia sinica]|uniref:uncharacterized protein LOC131246332 isoform X8 n=1 Tax=Magnolia sinica TaxID=86752 RepID=UPI0026598EA1|nr:uncharacterized protein LOC131246332 isoform X8 [Magnolia sinica]